MKPLYTIRAKVDLEIRASTDEEAYDAAHQMAESIGQLHDMEIIYVEESPTSEFVRSL